ncbi:hypothetical protein SOHN41_03074 [Shewanella sp. HN-41]|nr:hypothetical protein SOHN41_03074 [Shewanella sp. HN-41]
MGVVVGNIGWDQTAKVKESGFEIAHEFFNVILIIALATLSISFICIDLVDFIQGKNDYRDLSLKKLLFCLITLALLFGVETYYARKKFNKKINADE